MFYKVLVLLFVFVGSSHAKTIDNLPKVLKTLILTNANVKDVLNFCSTSKENKSVCDENNNALWKALVERDFGSPMPKDPGSLITWKNLYMTYYKNAFGRFVSIPGGTYAIGSPITEKDRKQDEKLHDIQLSDFSIMEAAVTQENYAQVMGENPSRTNRKKYCENTFKEITVKDKKIEVCPDLPVDYVSYEDAQKFALAMNKIDPTHKYSLPTEAQLEVAFRGGTTTAYVSGDDDKKLGDYVWYNKNSNYQTQPVSGKLPNAFGVYRSSVWEWAKDFYSKDYVGSSGLDPQGPSSGWYRVVRGCSSFSLASECRSAYRKDRSPSERDIIIGFRLVRTNS